jgi:hypothetical protein
MRYKSIAKGQCRMRTVEIIALVLFAVIFLLLIAIGFYIRFPEPINVSPMAFFIGNQGVLPLILNLGTFVGAAVTLMLLFRRARHDQEQLQHARETTRLALFKDAAVLLGQSDTACANGINIFGDLASSYPKQFLAHVCNGLAAMVTERTATAYQEAMDGVHSKVATNTRMHTPLVLLNALGVLGNVRPDRGAPWPEYVGAGTGRYEFGWAFLDSGNVRSADYSFCDIRTIFLKNFGFRGCDLTESHLEIVVSGTVQFIRCTLSHTSFNLLDDAGRTPSDPDFNATIIFEDCTIIQPSAAMGVIISGDMTIGIGG